MVSQRHVLIFSALILLASAPAAFSQTAVFPATTNSSPQFIATPSLVVHGTSPGALGGVGIVGVKDFNGDGRADILTSSGRFNSTLILYTQNSDGSFTAGKPFQLPAGNAKNGTLAAPDSVTIADLNGDGIPDLIVGVASDLNQNETPDDNGAIYTYLGNGDGTFRYYAGTSVGETSGIRLTVANLGGDDRPDLIVVLFPKNSLVETRVYMNQGDGRFRAGQSLGQDNVLAAGVFSSNGHTDLVVAPPSTGEFTAASNFEILKGKGDGTFTPGAIYPFSDASMVTVGDLNGDRNLDLVVTNTKNSTVYLGNGDGTFLRSGVVPTVPFRAALVGGPGYSVPLVVTQDVYIADFNGDNKPDLAVVSNSIANDPQNDFFGDLGEMIAIYPGNGTGTFKSPRIYNVDSLATSDAVADIRGNGTLDFLLSGETFSLLAGDGHGNFRGPVITLSESPSSIAAGDFNRDGIPDIAVVNRASFGTAHGTVSILPGSGKGYLGRVKTYPIGLSNGIIAVGDVNHDGKLDIVVTRRGTLNPVYGSPSPIDTSVLLGRGDGTFQPAMNFTVLGQPAEGVHDTSAFLVDINHDGKLDLVGDWGVAFGRGDGSFDPPIPLPSGITYISAMALADFNHDGFADLALATSNYGSQYATAPAVLYTLLGNGKGQFRIVQTQWNANMIDIDALTAADLNKDGIPDLIFTSLMGTNYTSYLNAELGKGNGTFADTSQSAIANYYTSGVAADFDRDGKLDVALSDKDGTVYLFRGTGRGTFLPPTTYNAMMSSMIAVHLNGNGGLDIAGTTPVGVVRLLNTGHRDYAAAAKQPAKK